MVSVVDVAKEFGSRVLWDGLGFDVEHGQMLALTGASGAGKTTLLNCLGLLETVDRGHIVIGGADVTRFGPRRARLFRRDQLGYLFQNYALIENATVADNLDVASRPGRGRRGGYEEALEQVGLAGRLKEKVFRLSGGEQQRVALARLIVKRPVVVLADEPTGALDEANADAVIKILRGMASQGCAVIIATHNPRVEAACDSVVHI
ncbi:ATP-binding cassette domain-containing protein [Thermoactinospora rubra]|uniref:ATP-binding cassette domain-containing protein n=1 Tax=Thermoactinospora rubra TaxID=1088767 RepID=UPI000A110D60|nr:ATP-binding cassette domain-containing protein [Thermoactinospora rubra]